MSYEVDQRKFLSHCKTALPNFAHVMRQAQQAKAKAERDCVDQIQKRNAGSQAANLVFLHELKKIGAEKWRKDKII